MGNSGRFPPRKASCDSLSNLNELLAQCMKYFCVDHTTTDCEAYSFTDMDMGSLTLCANLDACHSHIKGGQAQTSLRKS